MALLKQSVFRSFKSGSRHMRHAVRIFALLNFYGVHDCNFIRLHAESQNPKNITLFTKTEIHFSNITNKSYFLNGIQSLKKEKIVSSRNSKALQKEKQHILLKEKICIQFRDFLRNFHAKRMHDFKFHFIDFKFIQCIHFKFYK